MQVIPLLNKLNKDFISQYLKALGISNPKLYLKPNENCFDNPFDYPNMEQAINLLDKYLIEHIKIEKIGILIDSDCDGSCSAALMALFLKELGIFNIKFFYHEGKQHGIHTKVDEILKADIDLLIIPDAGSNDVDDCKILKSNGIDIIILDHHLIEKPNPYAIVVNPFAGENLNTAISGTGVVYKFVDAYITKHNIIIEPDLYCDIVAVSLISDVCNLATYENRAFINIGFNHPTNSFLIFLFEKCCKYRGVNPDGIGWDIAPLCNALARSEDQDGKLLFFNGLIGEIDSDKALKEIRKIKRTQDNAVKEVVDELEPTLDLNHKVIVGFSDAENKSYLGLIANKFCGKYGKPTILLRELNSTTWTGSFRSPVPLAEKINKSGLAKAQGHEEAAGIFIQKAYFNRFKDWLETLDLSERPPINVASCIDSKDITLDLCKQIDKNKMLWGHGVPKPLFYTTITIPIDTQVFRKSTNTVKYHCGDIDFLRFFCSEDDINKLSSTGNSIQIIFSLGVNEWEGIETPQAIIEQYELIDNSNNDNEDWRDLF